MKKILVTALLSALLVLTVTGCGNNGTQTNGGETVQQEQTQQQTQPPAEQQNVNNMPQAAVSQEDAKATALKDAGFKESEVNMTQQKLEYDDGYQVYEIDFIKDDREYDYTIDAQSGEILKRSEDVRYEMNPQSAGADISIDKAKSIALEKANGASGDNMHINLENEDGWRVYEGEIYGQDYQYEFEIDAVTGNILSWSQEKAGIDD